MFLLNKCLINALHLCLNCVYVGYRQTWMQLKERDGWSLEEQRSERGAG